MRTDQSSRSECEQPSPGVKPFREFMSAVAGMPAAKRPRDATAIRHAIGEALVAFANADGGELLVGVEDDGRVTGTLHGRRRPRKLSRSMDDTRPPKPLPVKELIRIANEVVPGLRDTVVEAEDATLPTRPRFQGAAWAPYDTTRLSSELGWRPESIDSRFASYRHSLEAEQVAKETVA